MDYEKKYKNALEWARQVMNGETGFIRKEVEEVFPELKSKDERIRKRLITMCQHYIECYALDPYNVDDYKEALTWLEKQGGEPFDYENANIQHKDFAPKSQRMMSAKAKEALYGKPTWSEEDERNLQGVIDEIEANKSNAPDYDLTTYDRFISWLKSIKERYTWKPSDKQMDNLSRAFNGATYRASLLRDLYLDLKKLKEG